MAKWQKGQSGNPGGRPAAQGEIREIARKHTSAAIETLARIMSDSNATASARVSAAIAVLDRAWGRPAQTINATVDNVESFSSWMPDIKDLLAKFGTSSEQAASTHRSTLD